MSFRNKDELKAKAAAWDRYIRLEYSKEISESQSGTTIYDEHTELVPEFTNPVHVTVEDIDSISAVHKYTGEGKVCLLNFASYRDPGGGFTRGGNTQEEDICHGSTLFPVLNSRLDDYYKENRWREAHENNQLYENRALYTPSILFPKGDTYSKADVLTCAAPKFNKKKYTNNFLYKYNDYYMRSRAEFVIDVAIVEEVDVLVLGAFGCGAFQQDPSRVASYFRDALIKDGRMRAFRKVVFAIPTNRGKPMNYLCFHQMFEKFI